MSNEDSSSVEEVAALLGTAINRLHQANGQTFKTVTPPPGLPSIFSTVNPIPCRELYDRLVSLRSILRSLAGVNEEDEKKTHSWTLSRQGDVLRSFIVDMSSRNESSSSSPSYTSLPAAPSILQLLLKLLSISSSLAQTPVFIHSSTSSINANTSATNSKNKNTTAPIRITPPLSSPVLRALWVECTLLCHRLSPLTSPSSFDSQSPPQVTATTKNNKNNNPHAKILSIYQEYASANPKSSKALGGTRIACLLVFHALFMDICIGQRLLPYADVVLDICHRALKSSGAHDAIHRVEAVRCASAVAFAVRWAYLQRKNSYAENNDKGSVFWCQGAMEDSMIIESVKIIRRSSEDNVPEVRKAGAEFVSILSSMLIHNIQINGAGAYVCLNPDVVGTNPLSSMEDIFQLLFKNLDDVSPAVAILWAESLARCMCTVVEYHESINRGISLDTTQKRSHQENDVADRSPTRRTQIANLGSNTASDIASKFRALADVRVIKNTTIGISCSMCTSLALALASLKDLFIKVGGETVAVKLGSVFSVGGRSVRIGLGTTFMFLVQFQTVCGGIGSNGVINTSDVLAAVLGIVGKELETINTQLPERTTNMNDSALTFNDLGLCVFTACRILRRGLSEASSEATQVSLLRDLSQFCHLSKGMSNGGYDDTRTCTYLQLQVVLVEISNLLVALGEAAASASIELISALKWCLSSPDRVVRHEAAVAYQAMAYTLPFFGRNFIIQAIDEIQVHIDEIVSYAVTTKEFMLLEQNFQNDNFQPIYRTFSVHGHALALSLTLHEISRKEGGLSSAVFDTIISLATTLIQCQYDKTLVTAFAAGACEYALAGWTIISAFISLGPTAVNHFSERLFDAWSQFTKPLNTSNSRVVLVSELKCFDAKLKSVVVFLKYCSPMLLSHSRALASSILFAEKCLVYLRDDVIFSDDVDQFLKDSLRSSLAELFSWLPPGTFPHLADDLFSFSTTFLRKLSLIGISCSLLPSLLTSQENLLHGASLTHCDNLNQTGGALYLDENLSSLRADFVRVSERESIIPLVISKDRNIPTTALTLDEAKLMPEIVSAPTPLHLVGNWRQPPSPSSSSCIRLVDASIHLFSVLFGMRDGIEQDSDIRLLDELSSTSAQNIKVLMTSALSEKYKQLEETVQINVAATLLSCLHSVPTAEESSDNIQTAGPPWMKRAASLLMKFSSSHLSIIRRAGAEGLALLSSLGVVEDAYLIQSSIIHSLGSILDSGSALGSTSNRKSSIEFIDHAKAGAVLAIGCIQRTAWTRTRKILAQEVTKDVQSNGESVIIMLARILPAVATYSPDSDSIIVRTSALHTWATLLQDSDVFDTGRYTIELQSHLLCKSIEILENNFFASWSTVLCEEAERVDNTLVDISYLAVLIRFLTTLTRRLYLVNDAKRILERFASMVLRIVYSSDSHSLILQEALSFLKEVHSSIDILLSDLSSVLYQVLSPSRPQVLAFQGFGFLTHFSRSLSSEKSSLQILYAIVHCNQQQQRLLFVYLLALVDRCWGCQNFFCANSRFMIQPRNQTFSLYEIYHIVSATLDIQLRTQAHVDDSLQDSASLAQRILSGAEKHVNDNNFLSSPTRWQVKFEAVRILIKVWQKVIANNVEPLHILNIEKIVLASCSTSMSTSDQSDLPFLQALAGQLLYVVLRSMTIFYPSTFRNSLSEKIVGPILLSVKHALNALNATAENIMISEAAIKLFQSGCECLPMVCEYGIIPDAVVLKRLLQILIGIPTHTKQFGYDSGRRYKDVVQSQLNALSKIYFLSKLSVISEEFFVWIEIELLSRLRDISTLCAVLAFDSFNDEKYVDSHQDTKPYLTAFSSLLLIHALKLARERDVVVEAELKLINSWLDSISALVITKLYWYLGYSPSPITPFSDNVRSIEKVRVTAILIRSLTELVESDNIPEIVRFYLSPTIRVIFDVIIFPHFDASLSDDVTQSLNSAITEASGLILSICRASCTGDTEKKRMIHYLIPLVNHYKMLPDQVTTTIIQAVDHLLTHSSHLFDEVAISIFLSFTLGELFLLNERASSDDSAHVSLLLSLIKSCFTHQSISIERQRSIIYQCAVNKRWKLWLVTCLNLRNPADSACSFSVIQEQLCDLDDSKTIQSIISAIAQLASERIDSISILVFFLGHKLIDTLLIYGLCRLNRFEARLPISSDIIKFLLLSFQALDQSGPPNGSSVQFLGSILESLVSIIQFNGLPDESSNSNSDADPYIGRICAQTFVSLARYSPLKLKESMMQLSIEQTLVIESAMRADIAGYVKASLPKKKIDLKGYIK